MSHSDSDSWVIMSANITSFNSQQDSLLELPFDIVAIQETRRTSKTQQFYSAFLKKKGFNSVWGKPQPFRAAKSSLHSSTGLNGRPGGVAILASSHIPLQFIPPGDCPTRKRLFHSCRWTHAVAADGNGKSLLRNFSVYGFTGHYGHSTVAELNDSFLHDLLELSTWT